MNKKILVVDDDSTFCLMLSSFLTKHGFEVCVAGKVNTALKILELQTFDLILSDYMLPDKDGMILLEEILKSQSGVPVIMMTSYGDIRLAVRAIKLGAFDYITKPVNPDILLELVKNALKQGPIKKDVVNTADRVQFAEGAGKSWEKLQKSISLVGPTMLSVIIEGESGTGKEFVARKIHDLSYRSDKPFIAVDCGALSNEIAASELFGHVKGSFTGALVDKAGQFELANGGTIFLDEIGNLSYDIQIMLLRATQERVIKRIGGTKDIDIDVRIIAATNEDLKNEVHTGAFREDLFHRLNEFAIQVDPLRERKEDIPVFAYFFLQKANDELGKNVKDIDKETMDLLLNYSWPGNIRELKNIIRKAALFTGEDKITIHSLPSEILIDKAVFEKTINSEETNLKTLTSNIEKDTILRALKKTRYNKSAAARLLSIDRKTLYNKLRDHDIDL